jgi:hypothetical protein
VSKSSESEFNKAGFLASKFSKMNDVVSAVAVDATTLELQVRPESVGAWDWWQERLRIEPGTVTYRGSVATASTMFGSQVRVRLTALGVGDLLANWMPAVAS